MTIKYAKQTLLVEQLNEIEHFFYCLITLLILTGK